MPRGGQRKGTPGKAYANRTDMGMNYDMQSGSPASGGIKPVSPESMQLPVYPDQLPSLSTPTTRPNEPITDGLAIGPGRGPEALTNYDPRLQETQALKQYLPLLEPLARNPETPDSVRALVNYIRSV